MNVGFYGGTEIRQICPASDMQTFFGCVRLAAARLTAGGDNGLLTDRLYRRYLRRDELAPASSMLMEVREILTEIRPNTVD